MIDDNTKEQLRAMLPTYVQSITQPDRRAGRNMYKCPLCKSGHGSGRNSNGAFSITSDGKSWKCFSCNQGGDIFTLIGLYEGLTEFKDQLERAATLYGVDTQPRQRKERKKREEKPAMQNYKEYIAACHAAASKTTYFKQRGFTDEIIERFNLGYDESKGVIVIPYDQNGSYYITRSTEGKTFRKPPNGSQDAAEPVYNRAALYSGLPCFVCESPIDAISIMAAGGGSCTAVALGGTGSRKLIDQVKAKEPTSVLILSFDNDEAGKKATDTAAADLAELENVTYFAAAWTLDAYPEDQRKDANDLLRGNKDQLAADIAANVAEIERRKNAEKAERLEAHNATSGAARLKDFIGGIKEGANTSYTPTGFTDLDKELDGGLYPGLYILGAISSMGKTTLLLHMADNIAEGGQDVLYFSLEMAASEIISKSISRLTFELCDEKESYLAKTARGITTGSRYKSYSRRETNLINDAIAEYGEKIGSNLYIYEGVGDIGVEQVRQAIKEHIELTGRTPLIFIDYLQILAPYDLRASDKQNTDKAVLELKRISRDYKTAVVGISSFNRDNYSTAVNMAAFKESGAIEYGSDVLLALQPQGMLPGYNKTDQKKNAELVDRCKRSDVREVEAVILKNRNGKTGGKVGFKYRSLFNHFEKDNSYDPKAAIEALEKSVAAFTGWQSVDDDDDGFLPFGADN